jgi:hypothetical protein
MLLVVYRLISLLNNRFFICIVFTLIAFWPLGQKAVFADRFYIIDNMSFGVLVTSTGGGSIVLSKDELQNPTEPYNGLLRLSGGKIGIIRYVPETEEEYIIFIEYPTDYYLDNDEKACLKNMHKYSTSSVSNADSKPYFDIELGGELHVDPGFTGVLSKSIPINITLYYE